MNPYDFSITKRTIEFDEICSWEIIPVSFIQLDLSKKGEVSLRIKRKIEVSLLDDSSHFEFTTISLFQFLHIKEQIEYAYYDLKVPKQSLFLLLNYYLYSTTHFYLGMSLLTNQITYLINKEEITPMVREEIVIFCSYTKEQVKKVKNLKKFITKKLKQLQEKEVYVID